MTCPSERIFTPERRHCLRNVVSLTPGANRLRRCSSSFIQAKKTCPCRQVSKMVGERGLRAPSDRCVRNVVSLRSAQPSFGGFHPLLFRRKKTCLCRQVSKNGRRERITRPCGTCPSGRCVRNVVSLRSAQTAFGGSHPLLFRRKKTCPCRQVSKNGRRERIRTSDPLVPNQLRYQAALLADFFILFCLVRREGLEPSRPLRH